MGKSVECKACHGTGQVQNPAYRGTSFEFEQCKVCSGTGTKNIVLPEKLDNPDFTAIIELAEQYINDISEKGWADEDFPQWIFESAISSIYGPGVWKFISNR